MKRVGTLAGFCLILCSEAAAEPFRNLDFEQAQVASNATWGTSLLDPAQAIPHWVTGVVDVQYSLAAENGQPPSGPALFLYDGNHTQVLEGRFTLHLHDAAISQQGDVPFAAATLQFLRTGAFGPQVTVSVDGEPQPVFTARRGEEQWVERVDMRAFAGQNVELTIAGTSGIDQLQFAVIPLVAGDPDFDGDVDSADLTTLVSNWTGALPPMEGGRLFGDGDNDGDQDIDSADLNTLVVNWTGARAAPAPVPEPATRVAGGLVLLWLGWQIGRRHR